ncbi:toxin-antitoxin system, toxin component, Fic family [Aerococcus christensenii]|uniref:Toxin-antitoxin system, toxin component, Fic family n=1 Tax=Aerococcus christensenii TaxID=87541 RepID=A0A133XPC2_9LACT|nr:virulence RhuM family protein [Aerococcus christensenii]KXB32786.1 toxin-antitoxin system, toxin component, Fic family [Aerococcus christensenii]
MSNEFQFLMYKSAEENISVNALIKDETIWLNQKGMAELLGCSTDNISLHLKNIFADGELDKNSVTEKISATATDGKNYPTQFYNLDAIISVGYRVNSRKATKFRIWATSVLKEYMLKGFAMDDERLKQGKTAFGKDYFKELLERVRSIRASERRIWQQITDIFAECSIDYDKHSQITHDFYAMVQNKFHYAIVGRTAAEIVYTKANKTKKNMGLTTWENAPDGRILKSDVVIAKNYLEEKQIRQLERAVTGYFDYIEDLIERENTFTMEEFAASVNEFLAFRRYDILRDKGKISGKMAKEKATTEYMEFNKTQKITSDFDKAVNQMLKAGEEE